MDLKQIKTELGMSDADIARFFGYKNPQSYYKATRRPKIERGIVELYKLFKTKKPIK